ncbi:glycosyltransferase family 4 protein [Paludibacterium yongneupense]|uniref:glycosyltransferase family 4 protein n=1 Tax=Paludibacterium yongneupense TaxID=400061 RepID=UPI001FE75B89|nr:glycosyltransferase family 4 protein [Paludibacterium yongneupense]
MTEQHIPDHRAPRLAIVRQKYNAAGGAERFVSRAIQALLRSGRIEVSLIARRWETLEGVVPVCVNPFYLGNVWRDLGFARAARRIWQRDGFDLVQSHERIPGCDIYRAGDGVHARWLELRRLTLGPLGRLRLALNPYHHYVCGAERRMFLDPRLKLVVCNAHMVQEEIRQRFDLPQDRFVVIHNGVDQNAFHPDLKSRFREDMRRQWSIPEHAPLLLYVGSGFERKGVGRALAAIAALDDVHLVVVGRDKHAARYRREAARLGIGARVRFVGAQNDVKPFYGMADAFVLPTLYDPFPNVCVEALACGLPVFTTSTCGAAERIETGRNGWVVDPLDIEALGAAIAAWRDSRASWPALAAAARSSIADLTLEGMVETLLQHYRRLLDGLRAD